MDGGSQTKQGTPKPRAKAREDQEPEAKPPKQREEEEEGKRPEGQGEEGNESQRPPAAATARTQAAERAAKEPLPAPKSEARNTIAPGK
jgi:hypothetical protein